MATNGKSADGLAEESCITDILDPESRFECPICLTWLRDPVLTSCGHRFCRDCIEPWLKRKNPVCPVDNEENITTFQDNFTKREISQQRTKCPNIVRGCLLELSPLDVESHLRVCDFRIPESHLPENEKIRCTFNELGCESKFEDEPELNRHLEENIQTHLLMLTNVCKTINQATNSTMALAQRAEYWDPPSKNEIKASSSNEGIQNLLTDLCEKIVTLEQTTREQDIKILNMSEQISSIPLRCCNGSYIWHLTDFKNKINTMKNNNNMMYYSQGFYTSYYGYKICIRFNLSPRDPSYIALLVHMMRTDHDNTLDWPFSGKIIITIVHPKQCSRNIKETMMTRPELDAFKRPTQDLNPKGFGYTEFALLENLIEDDFIEKNQLIVKVVVQPV